MEDITGYPLVDKWDDLSRWKDDHVKRVLRDMAQMHSIYWNDSNALSHYPWLKRYSAEWARSTKPYWEENVKYVLETFSYLDVPMSTIQPQVSRESGRRLPLSERLMFTYTLNS
jgi:hypothetical protein